jgi:hypothetical protein
MIHITVTIWISGLNSQLISLPLITTCTIYSWLSTANMMTEDSSKILLTFCQTTYVTLQSTLSSTKSLQRPESCFLTQGSSENQVQYLGILISRLANNYCYSRVVCLPHKTSPWKSNCLQGCNYIPFNTVSTGCAMDHVVTHWSLTVETWVQSRASPCEILLLVLNLNSK